MKFKTMPLEELIEQPTDNRLISKSTTTLQDAEVQECPAVAGKPARRETMPKIAPVRT